MWKPFNVSAPGSLMLLGEHAVLHGSRAIACAVNHRIHIRFEPLADSVLSIESALGTYSTPLRALRKSKKFRFLIETFRGFTPESGGLHLHIESDFSHTVGLGSSAAVTVCALAGRMHLEGKPCQPHDILAEARRLIRKVQGRGSATDAAASTFGGVIAFQPKTLRVDSLPIRFPIALRYAGYKTATPEVIEKVHGWARQDPKKYQHLYQAMGAEVEQAIQAAESSDVDRFAQHCNQYQNLMRELGVEDETLKSIIEEMESIPSIRAAKISGSGLGDCVLGIGDDENRNGVGESISASLGESGVRIETI